VLDCIGCGLALPATLDAAYLPEALREHPRAVVPYPATHDNFAARLYHQPTGYREADGYKLAPQPAVAALDLLAWAPRSRSSGQPVPSPGRANPALAPEIIELGLLRYPSSAALTPLRQEAPRGLAELHQPE
jgi:hypothetical protein